MSQTTPPAETAAIPANTPLAEGATSGSATAPPKAVPLGRFKGLRGAGGPRSRRWGVVAGVAVPALGLAGAGVASGAYSSWAVSNQIAPGVTIAGEAVGGLSKDEAVERLEQRFGRMFVTLKTEKRPFVLSLDELGGEPAIQGTVSKAYQIGRGGSVVQNFMRVYASGSEGERMSLPMVWNKDDLVKRLRAVDELSKESPKNARLQITSRGVQILAETKGRALNIGETALQLQKGYYVGLSEIEAVSKETDPELTVESLSGKDVELARYTTRFNAGLRGRTANIHVAASSIEGSVLMPGERFSFNEKTGERTYDKGYRMAHIFEKKPGETESEVVDGLAGGTCQVSSTLYNAVMRLNKKTDGGLKLLERHHHSLPVTYVPDGQDATVAWPSLDFKFRNTLTHPVYLRTAINGSRITVSIWGRIPSKPTAPGTEGEELAYAPSPSATPSSPQTSPTATP